MSGEVGKRAKTRRNAGSDPRFGRFCQEYCRLSVAYRAALAAGYSPRMAHSKSYLLARRARRTPSYRALWRQSLAFLEP
jgi:hypothetical protein